MKRIFSQLMAVASALALWIGCSSPEPATDSSYAPEGVIVHLFEWRWDDVAQECEQFLGPNGYAAVQVSSPTENHVVEGRPWWERYQPVSYGFDTRSGDRAAFADMVSRCDTAGVDVIVDVVLNHMADADLVHEGDAEFTGRGTGGSTFGPWDYPGLYAFEDFHHCGLTDNNHIWDWDDRAQVTECELLGLSDLDTSSPKVRSTLATYLADLSSMGVAGFRLDAARHIKAEDIDAILDESDTEGYVVQEILTAGRVEPWLDDYLAIGNVTDFAWTEAIGQALRHRSWSDLEPGGWFWTSRQYVPSNKSLVFVDNHDRQRGHGGEAAINFKDGALYELAQVFTLAWPQGRKRVMSSYAFDDDFQGPPMDETEATLPVYEDQGVDCGNGNWVCEHRWPVIAGAVAFHNEVRDAGPVTDWWSDGEDVIAFGRGASGFVIINGSDAALDGYWPTSLAEGTYCNRLSEDVCESVTVDSEGVVHGRLSAMSALAIDTGSKHEG
jgi:alpha-amylase